MTQCTISSMGLSDQVSTCPLSNDCLNNFLELTLKWASRRIVPQYPHHFPFLPIILDRNVLFLILQEDVTILQLTLMLILQLQSQLMLTLIFMLQFICWSFCCILCCSLFACCWCFLWLKLHFYVAVFHEREVFPSHREVVVLENDGEDRWENAIIILLFFFISNIINICNS